MTTAAGRGVQFRVGPGSQFNDWSPHSATDLSFPLGRLGGFAVGCFRGNRRIRRASGLSGVRCSGLREPDAGLITVGELDARDL